MPIVRSYIKNPTISPFTTMFHKRVKKLTEKAAQAVAESTHKLKRKVSTGSQEPSQAKKSKHLSSTSDSEESSPTPHTTSRRATVQTEEEDGISPPDAIIMDSDTSSDDAEASEAELGKLFILIAYHYVNQFSFHRPAKKRMDVTSVRILRADTKY